MRFNPLRSLTPERLASALDQHAAGYLREAALIFETIEQREAIVRSVMTKRRAAVARRDWTIVVPDPENPLAEAHKATLEHFYNNITVTDATDLNVRTGMSGLLRQMMDAIIQRYAVHEIIWKPGADGLTAELRRVPLYFFENRSGKLRFTGPENRADGMPLEDDGWMVTVADGLGEALSICWMFKRLGIQDLLAFSEKFSVPGVLGRTTAAKGSDAGNAMRDSVLDYASEWVGIVYGDDGSIKDPVQIIQSPAGGSLPPMEIATYFDRMIATLVRGGDLSTISRDNGNGSNPQSDETDALLEDDCALVSETLQTQLDRMVIKMVHGDETPAAYIVIEPPATMDSAKELAIDAGLAALGVKQDPADLAERYGREVISDQSAVISEEEEKAAENYNATQPRIPKGSKAGAGQWTDEPEYGGNGVPYQVERKLRKKEDAAIDGRFPVRTETPPSAEDLRMPPAETDDAFAEARKQWEAEQLEESMDGFPEVASELKGKLPRPEDMDPGDPLKGEVQMIWDRFKKETRNTDRLGRNVIAPSGAAQYFAPKGTRTNIDGLREGLNEIGFAFDTPQDMLTAVYESLEGRKQWGTMSTANVAAANELDAIRSALTSDLQPLGEALAGALQAGDEAAFRAALKKISARMPDFLESPALEELMQSEMVQALTKDESES